MLMVKKGFRNNIKLERATFTTPCDISSTLLQHLGT